jgi:hypothetical protein
MGAAADVEHEHPDDASEEGDLASLERWLSNEMSQRHVNCSEGLSVGNFDACEDLDEEYKSLLSQYVSVERDLEGETTTADRLNETRAAQREYARLLNEFNATYQEYQDAREAGETARARELARELQRLAVRIDELGGDLGGQFRELDGEIAGNLSSASTSINESRNDTQAAVAEIEQETFEPTTITAVAEPRASFASPGLVTGLVTTENETRVAGGQVVVRDGEQNFTAPVSENGTYRLAYRPAVTPRGETNLTIHYRPAVESPYLGTNTTSTVLVDGMPSTVRIGFVNESVVLAAELRVIGTVHATDRRVADVPVTISINGAPLIMTHTNESGWFNGSAHLPPNVSAGVAEVSVTASEPGRAIRPSRTIALLSVGVTPTDLRVTATRNEETVAITGRLTTDVNATIGERPLTVTVGDSVYNVTTDAEGYYSLTHDTDGEPRDGAVTAAYQEAGSNLGASTAETSLTDDSVLAALLAQLTPVIDDVWQLIRSNHLLSGVLLLGLFVNLVIWSFALRSRWRSSPESPSESAPPERPAPETSAEAPDDPSPDRLLDAARRQVGTNPEAAVQAGYAAVRTELNGNRDSKTHWEFYQAMRPELPEERNSSLRSITESFERATFAAEGIDTQSAEKALEDAERCLSGS